MDEAEKKNGPTLDPERQIRDDEVLALLQKETRGVFAPGTSWAYSNSGYVVLGLIAARAAGKPFGDVLRERIFAPLGMTRTLAYEKGRNEVPDRAYGHTKEADGIPRDRPELDLGRPSATAASTPASRTSRSGTRRCARTRSCPRRRRRRPSRRRASRDGSRAALAEREPGRRQPLPWAARRLRLRMVPRPVAGPAARVAPRRDDGLPSRSSSVSREAGRAWSSSRTATTST